MSCAPPLEHTLFGHEIWLQPHDIDEVFSLALERLWRSRKSFDPKRATLYTWFRTIVLRLAYDRLKTNRRRLPREGACMDPDLMNNLLSASQNDVARDASFEQFENEERRRQRIVLRQSIRRLSHRLRQVALADLNSSSTSANDREMAGKLGVKVATVRRYRREAYAQLQQLCRITEREQG